MLWWHEMVRNLVSLFLKPHHPGFLTPYKRRFAPSGALSCAEQILDWAKSNAIAKTEKSTHATHRTTRTVTPSDIFWVVIDDEMLGMKVVIFQTRAVKGTTSVGFQSQSRQHLVTLLCFIGLLFSHYFRWEQSLKFTMNCSASRILFLLPLVVMVLITNVEAFTSRTCFPSTATRTDETQLSAWSLPSPSDFSGFTPLKSTWYDEHNPTARQAVYNE